MTKTPVEKALKALNSEKFIKASQDVTDEALKFIALTPTEELVEKVEIGFFQKLTDADFMRIAVHLAEKAIEKVAALLAGL